jgi:hypothetical protein
MAGTQVGVAACAIAESAPRQWRLWDLKRGDLAKTGQSCSWQRWPWMEAVWRSARLHGPGWSESHQESSLALVDGAPPTSNAQPPRAADAASHSASTLQFRREECLLPSFCCRSIRLHQRSQRSRKVQGHHLNAATSWPAAANRTSRISWVRERIARTCPTVPVPTLGRFSHKSSLSTATATADQP